MKRDCPKLKQGGGNKKTCGHCGKTGHVEADCWKKHPEKKPSWANKEDKDRDDEVVGIAVDQELSFTVIDHSDPFELLSSVATEDDHNNTEVNRAPPIGMDTFTTIPSWTSIEADEGQANKEEEKSCEIYRQSNCIP